MYVYISTPCPASSSSISPVCFVFALLLLHFPCDCNSSSRSSVVYLMDVHRHEAALRAVQKPPAKPWRATGTGAGAPPPPPPKVYRVEPREFRDLVQRLTGAPPTATARHHHQPTTMQPQQPVPVRAAAAGEQQVYYAPSWLSFPMAGMMDAHHHGNGGALM